MWNPNSETVQNLLALKGTEAFQKSESVGSSKTQNLVPVLESLRERILAAEHLGNHRLMFRRCRILLSIRQWHNHW